MSKTILNINGDNQLKANKSNLKLFARSINHSFKTTEQRQKINDVIHKNNNMNLTYFNGKFGTNNENISNKLIEKLENDLSSFKQQWSEKKPNGTYNIPWDKMINGGNTKNIFNETIIGFSNDFYSSEAGFIDKDGNIDYKKAQGYFEWELDRYKHNFKEVSGHDLNIIGATLHLDETTPHIHLFTHNVYKELDKRSSQERYKVSFKLNNKFKFSKIQELQETTARDFLKNNYQYDKVEQRNKRFGEPYDPKLYERTSLNEWKAMVVNDLENLQKDYEKEQEQYLKLKEKTTNQEQRKDKYEQELNDMEYKISLANEKKVKAEAKTMKPKFVKWLIKVVKGVDVDIEYQKIKKELNEYQDQVNDRKNVLDKINSEIETKRNYLIERDTKIKQLEIKIKNQYEIISKLENENKDLKLNNELLMEYVLELKGLSNTIENENKILKELEQYKLEIELD